MHSLSNRKKPRSDRMIQLQVVRSLKGFDCCSGVAAKQMTKSQVGIETSVIRPCADRRFCQFNSLASAAKLKSDETGFPSESRD